MWAKTWGSGSATKTDCLHMVGTDTGLKDSNPVCEGKVNTGASTIGGDCHILCYLCPSCCKYLWPSKRRKQTEQTTQVLLRVCQGAEPDRILYDVYGTLHFSKAQILPKLLRAQLLVCAVSFTSLCSVSCYWAFNIHCLLCLLTVCISLTWQSKSGPPVSLSFHLPFLFHNVKLLRLQILMGNISLQRGFQLLASCFIRIWLWRIIIFPAY